MINVRTSPQHNTHNSVKSKINIYKEKYLPSSA